MDEPEVHTPSATDADPTSGPPLGEPVAPRDSGKAHDDSAEKPRNDSVEKPRNDSVEKPRNDSVEKEHAPGAPVVLFDGRCNLCNGTIQFIVDHERAATLRFAPLQSDVARAVLEQAFGRDEARRLVGGATGDGDPDSVVLVDGARGYTHSTAGLRIAAHLRAPYRWLLALLLVPRPLRDLVYRWIARNRYRWFGKSETCRVPTPALRARFLA
ncbi:MAG: thiol-disulfide oxidoreductase DCC family protein [Labilithrix sp.]|nr:thiol-disulfide oxidoreductase DCC family protein [Labilithrix sp.]